MESNAILMRGAHNHVISSKSIQKKRIGEKKVLWEIINYVFIYYIKQLKNGDM